VRQDNQARTAKFRHGLAGRLRTRGAGLHAGRSGRASPHAHPAWRGLVSGQALGRVRCARLARPQDPVLPRASVSRPISRVLSGGLPLRDGHSSGTPLARRLEQPTRAAAGITPGWPGAPAKKAHAPNLRAAPIRSCSRWGLPCRLRHRRRGALLPHRFTLAPVGWPAGAVSSLWHFPWGRPRRPLAATDNPWSPDFPPPHACGRKAGSRGSGRPAG